MTMHAGVQNTQQHSTKFFLHVAVQRLVTIAPPYTNKLRNRTGKASALRK